LTALASDRANPFVAAARAFHTFPGSAEVFAPSAAPLLDFHQAVSSLGSFPHVMASFGLVFRLDVPLPLALKLSASPAPVVVQAVPKWRSAFSGNGGNSDTTVNVALQVQAELSSDRFFPSPAGPDYGNGMLDLADASRFSVIDVDVDGAAESLTNLAISVQSLRSWLAPLGQSGATLSMPVPALRSIGPSIVWSGWGSATSTTGSLNALAKRQTDLQGAVTDWANWYLGGRQGSEPSLPTLRAEDIIRGHRFDVHTLAEPKPAWRSLHERVGSYTFGAPSGAQITETFQDEGTVVPAATQPATTKGPLPDLYVHESIARWAGWSLSAPRNGPSISPDDQVDENPSNPVPTSSDGQGSQNPQMAVTFQVAPGSLPKLRYGRRYRYRARAVDLGGYSLPVSDPDGSSATPPVTHYRHQPVASPVAVPDEVMRPGEAALLVPILNYQLGPGEHVATNGRWLFPPPEHRR
jgi:hypothetical protein